MSLPEELKYAMNEQDRALMSAVLTGTSVPRRRAIAKAITLLESTITDASTSPRLGWARRSRIAISSSGVTPTSLMRWIRQQGSSAAGGTRTVVRLSHNRRPVCARASTSRVGTTQLPSPRGTP